MSVYLPLYVILSRNALMHFANSVDIDETPHFAAFDLGLHCLPMAYNTQGNPMSRFQSVNKAVARHYSIV